MDTRNKIFTVIGVVAITAAAGIGGYALFAKPDDTTSTSSPVTTSRTVSSSTMGIVSASTTYKDGTYSASRDYQAPEGHTNSIDATITVTGGKIASIDAKGHYNDRESSVYVDSFNSSVTADATGQTLASYSPSRIGGASLTTGAFNEVLDTIRSEARG